ncbi:MAG: tRNA dihydrouridine synthase [Saccharofermentanales bacterium]|jgi:tRNA-dihydrouridine synthase B
MRSERSHRESAPRRPRASGGFLALFDADRPPVGLAPMAGFTTPAFRTLAVREGASFTTTELVSAKGLRHDPDVRRAARFLVPTEGDAPWGIQLFGHEPEDFRWAVARLLSDARWASCAFIDLNMGCPAPKVVRAGAGCALMRDPEQVRRIVEATVDAARAFDVPVTVKMRSGIDARSIDAPDVARAAVAGGASAVTVHGRTLDQFYAGQADWHVIARVREAIPDTPLLGNGDVATREDLRAILAATGCDGVQIGRAARGNPFVFSRLMSSEDAGDASEQRMLRSVSSERWLRTMTEQLDRTIDLLGEDVAVREMRASFAFYLKGYPGAVGDRRDVMRPTTREGVLAVLERAARRRTTGCDAEDALP